jgi:polar amino acid transport system substrate-binding protein
MIGFAPWRLVAALIVALALVGGACGGGTNKTASGTKLTALGKKLPKAIQDSGEVRVGSDIEYAPVEFFKENTKTAQGIDVDVANAMGTKLGVKFRFIDDTDFAGIILALRSGRFDIVMSAMNDTAERRGKGVDFIDYFVAGTSILAKKGNPLGITSLDDLCGKTVAVQKGTVQETDILAPQQPKCTAAGKPKIDVLTFEKDTDALQQVKTGRAVADLEDFPVAAYNEKISGNGNDFQVVGTPGFEVGQYGIAVPKEKTSLRDALRSALQAVIADGTYDQILQKWNVSGGALKTAPLNGGG